MTRTLTQAGIAIVIVFLLAPVFAFAAYNDVTLTSDTVLSVNSITINVEGSDSVLESIEVGATSFTVTFAAGSSIAVTAPDRNVIGVDSSAGQTTNVCNDSESTLAYTATEAGTVVFTPQSTLCASPASSGGSSGGGGGGGGGSSTAVVPQPASTTAVTTQAAPTSTSSEFATLANQLRELIKTLKSLGGTPPPGLEAMLNTIAPVSTSVFTRDLEVGMTGDDVKALQQWLNTHGYQVAATGPGSPGNETTRFGAATRAALISFQKAKGISPAVGYFGPKTRSIIQSM